jgi:hypothetical protein
MQAVVTVTLDVPRAVSRSGLDLFLQKLLWESDSVDSSGPPLSIIRLKVGFLCCVEQGLLQLIRCSEKSVITPYELLFTFVFAQGPVGNAVPHLL